MRLLILVLVLTPALLRAETLSVENKAVRVTYDDATNTFTIFRVADGKPIATDGKLPLTGPAKATIKKSGSEPDSIRITDADGQEAFVLIDPTEPNIAIGEKRKNAGT